MVQELDDLVRGHTFARRIFFETLPLLLGPRSLSDRGRILKKDMKVKLKYLTLQEYAILSRIAADIAPLEATTQGIDIALNLDRFIFLHPSHDWLRFLQYLRLIAFADAIKPILRLLIQGLEKDLMSLKRVICFMGYYSGVSGEGDNNTEDRLVWASVSHASIEDEYWLPAEKKPTPNLPEYPDR